MRRVIETLEKGASGLSGTGFSCPNTMPKPSMLGPGEEGGSQGRQVPWMLGRTDSDG